MSKQLTESQLKTLTLIKEAKKAPKKVAGHPATIKKLIDGGLISSNEPTKKLPEITYSLTSDGKAALKAAEKAAAKAAVTA
jgi:hypothetical protein